MLLKELADGVFTYKSEYPEQPYSTNAYIIKGDRTLLIDPGYDDPACAATALEALRESGADMRSTDFFVTHWHGDHVGALNYLDTKESKIFCSAASKKLFTGRYENSMSAFVSETAHWGGNFSGCAKNFNFGLRDLSSIPLNSLNYLQNGSVISIGGHNLCFLETPGHSDDHGVLFDESCGILFSGDLILKDVAPIIVGAALDSDRLKKYFRSLETVAALPVKTVAPGHGDSFELLPRIAEITSFHRRRIGQLRSLAKGSRLSAAELEEQLMNEAYKRFIRTAETVEYLNYLASSGEIHWKENEEGIRIYY